MAADPLEWIFSARRVNMSYMQKGEIVGRM